MKKTLLLILVSCYCHLLPAPERRELLIVNNNAINAYDRLIEAIVHVETDHGKVLYNPKENAVGYFQIRQIRVDDYNWRTKSNYKLSDFYDYDLSRKMFLYYTKDRSFEKIARSWNGSGPMTKIYWSKVKYHMS